MRAALSDTSRCSVNCSERCCNRFWQIFTQEIAPLLQLSLRLNPARSRHPEGTSSPGGFRKLSMYAYTYNSTCLTCNAMGVAEFCAF